jgi:hypothetical protein
MIAMNKKTTVGIWTSLINPRHYRLGKEIRELTKSCSSETTEHTPQSLNALPHRLDMTFKPLHRLGGILEIEIKCRMIHPRVELRSSWRKVQVIWQLLSPFLPKEHVNYTSVSLKND